METGGPSAPVDAVMLSKLLTICLLACLLATAAMARPRHSPPPEPELPGEQPEDDTPLSYADDWLASYVPNLIDIPATELVERHHPTFEMGYMTRHFGGPSFTNVKEAKQAGARFALHVRAGRDLQVSAETPVYQPTTSLVTGAFEPEGAFTALAAEIKYLVPYEIAGFRSAVGYRNVFVDDKVRPLFLPDDYERMNMVYATVSRTPTTYLRWHLMAARVFVPTLDGLPQGEHALLALGFENQLFRLEHNWVRLITEVSRAHFYDVHHSIFGTEVHNDDPWVNMGLRVRSGILQAEIGSRRLMQPGYDEYYANVVKRF